MQNTLSRFDALIARLLFVKPEAAVSTAAEITEPESEQTQTAERAFSFALLFSGVRCILMYVILPFVLPLIGLAGNFSIWLDIVINFVAIGAIIYSLRRFWRIDYDRKWLYLPVAVVALVVLIAFIALDVQTLI